jgi:(2Fe-2S) ferredoxin
MRVPYDKIFLACTGPRCNAETRGIECGSNIRDLLKDVNKQAGRKPTVRVLATSCLDLCDHGPNMVVEPEHVVYSHLTRESAVEVYRGEMGDGAVRADLQLDYAEFDAGASKAQRKSGD